VQGGYLISRWKRLDLFTIPEYSEWWNDVLSHPTPNLVSLNVIHLGGEKPMLPSAPNLKWFEMIHCAIRLGDLPNLELLKISGNTNADIFDFDTRSFAQNLTTLELLSLDGTIRLPAALPALEKLVLEECPSSSILKPPSLPRLRSLSYQPGIVEHCALLQWPGIDLGRAEFLSLAFKPDLLYFLSVDAILSKVMGLRQVIQAAENVKHFYAMGLGMIRFLLIWFEEGIHLGIRLRGCQVELKKSYFEGRTTTFYLRPEMTITDICQIQIFLNVPIYETLDSFLSNPFDPWMYLD
jgi:hypothetical protein